MQADAAFVRIDQHQLSDRHIWVSWCHVHTPDEFSRARAWTEQAFIIEPQRWLRSKEILGRFLIPFRHRLQGNFPGLLQINRRLGRKRNIGRHFPIHRIQIPVLVGIDNQFTTQHRDALMILLVAGGDASIFRASGFELRQFAFRVLQAKLRTESFGERQRGILRTEKGPQCFGRREGSATLRSEKADFVGLWIYLTFQPITPLCGDRWKRNA